MKLLLAIPSYNRPYDIAKHCHWLKDFKYDYKVFVEEDQVMYYEQSIGIDNIVQTPNGSGLMGQIVEIGRYATIKQYEIVFKMDDDMSLKKRSTRKHQIADVINEYVEKCLEQFKNEDVSLITCAKPMEYRYAKTEGFIERKRPVYGNYMVRQWYLLFMDKDLLLFDDLWISVEVVKSRKKILTYTGAYENAITHKNNGGLQSYDRDELGKRSYEVAKELYPQIEILENSKHKKFDISVKNYFK